MLTTDSYNRVVSENVTPTPEADAANVISIPDWNLDRLDTKFKAMAKKAAKLGCAAPTYEVVATREIEVTPEDMYGHVIGATRVEIWHDVIVTGESPRLAGHRLVAVIDRDLAEPDAPNVVNTLPDVEFNTAWRTVGDVCEHDACNGAARGRKKIIVVRHEDGTDRLVGSTCVASYLGGVDPSMVATYLSYVAALASLSDEEPTDERPHRTEVRFPLVGFLAVVNAMVNTYGWVSKATAWEYHKMSTVADACRWIDGKREKTDPTELVDGDYTAAEAAVAWAKTIDIGDKCGLAVDSYLANLNAVASKETIGYRDTGVAGSMIVAHRRHVEGEARKARAANSEHFGTVGKRIVVTGEVVGAYTYDSNYGTVTWITAITDDGNVVKWKSSGSNTPKRGTVITGKATIKDHGEYKDRKETVVSRWSWMIHPDHCEHTFVDRYGMVTAGDRRKPGRYSCNACGTPVGARDLLEALSADGLAIVTDLVWEAGRLPCTREDRSYNVEAADRYSAGRTVTAAMTVTDYNDAEEEVTA